MGRPWPAFDSFARKKKIKEFGFSAHAPFLSVESLKSLLSLQLTFLRAWFLCCPLWDSNHVVRTFDEKKLKIPFFLKFPPCHIPLLPTSTARPSAVWTFECICWKRLVFFCLSCPGRSPIGYGYNLFWRSLCFICFRDSKVSHSLMSFSCKHIFISYLINFICSRFCCPRSVVQLFTPSAMQYGKCNMQH
jgi:hypothetical protein